MKFKTIIQFCLFALIIVSCAPPKQNAFQPLPSVTQAKAITPKPTYTPLPIPIIDLPFPVGKPIEEGYEKITIENATNLVPIRELPLGTAKYRPITNIEFSPDGTTLLISQSDYSYFKFQIPINKFEFPWRGIGNATWTEKPGGYATFSPDGKWMVWGNDEDEIVFETITAEEPIKKTLQREYVTFGFSPNGKIFFTSSKEKTTFFDFNDGIGEIIALFPFGQSSHPLYQGTQVLIFQDNDRVCILGKGLYSISRNSKINDIYGCQYSYKGSVSKQNNDLTLVGKYMRLWDVGTNEVLFEEDPIKGEQRYSQDMTSEYYLPGARLHLQHGVPFDGSVFYLSISDDQGVEKTELQLPGEPSFFTTSPDGKYLAVGIHSIQTMGEVLVYAVPDWINEKLVNIKDFTNEEITFSEYSELITSTLTSMPKLRTITRDNITNLQVIGEISAIVQPNLISSYEWDLEPGFNSISFSPDGKYLALSYSFLHEFAFLDLTSNPIVPRFWSYRTNSSSIKFSPDGKMIAYFDNTEGDNIPNLIIRSFENGEPGRILHNIDACYGFHFSIDGKYVICLDKESDYKYYNKVRSFRIDTGEIVATQEFYWWGGSGRLNPDNTITVWRPGLENWQEEYSNTYSVPDLSPIPNYDPINRFLELSNDGSIASYCAEGNVGTIYHWADRKLIYQKGPCPSAFSIDGSIAVGLDQDKNSPTCGQIVAWDVQSREQIGITPSQVENTFHYSDDESVWGCLAGKAVLSSNYIFSPDGKVVIQVNSIYKDGRSGEVLTFFGVPE